MDVLSPPSPPNAPPESPPAPRSRRVVGGVAALIGARLGLDPLWVRMGFVVLALLSGIGLLVYAGLWLVLVAGGRPEFVWARWIGGAALIVGLPWLLAINDNLRFASGPVAVVALLVGLAVALWMPRPTIAPAGVPTVSAPAGDLAAAPVVAPRPPSILGRAALGLAVVVGAVGALIDQANGGRLHPEQWLGAAAAVCGLGLLIGAWRGRARWLIVPAVVFAGAGFIGGTAASVGGPWTRLSGDQWTWIQAELSPVDSRVGVVFGNVNLNIASLPSPPGRFQAATAFGSVRIGLPQDDKVAVEIHIGGTPDRVNVDGQRTNKRVIRLGPLDAPPLLIDARVGRGSVEIQRNRQYPETVPSTLAPSLPSGLVDVADGVQIASDGSVVLSRGDAIIAPDNALVAAGVSHEDSGRTILETGVGSFILLPRGFLVTPSGDVLELASLRRQFAPNTGDPTESSVPGSAAVPSTVAPTPIGG